MVEVIIRPRPDGTASYWWQEATGTPEIHVHYIERDVFGNGIGIKVYGEIKIASGEIVYAREMKLNCLQVLCLTPEYDHGDAGAHAYVPVKWIYHKSEFDNWASIDIYKDDGTWATSDLPADGSIWLDFVGLGE